MIEIITLINNASSEEILKEILNALKELQKNLKEVVSRSNACELDTLATNLEQWLISFDNFKSNQANLESLGKGWCCLLDTIQKQTTIQEIARQEENRVREHQKVSKTGKTVLFIQALPEYYNLVEDLTAYSETLRTQSL